MRIVLQRSKEANVKVHNKVIGSITSGLVLLVGVTHEDTLEDAVWCADKVANLRVFEDDSGKMNVSLLDVNGEILSISQFTLYGDCRKGRRPNFMRSAKPDDALPLYNYFNELLIQKGIKVEKGEFGAMMDVSLINDGPVTLILDSKDIKLK